MATITYTRKNILEALGVKEHVLRKWLETLPPYVHEDTRERYGRRYRGSDLLFFLIVHMLVEQYGIRVEVIAKFSSNLVTFLNRPISISSDRFLVINIFTQEIKVAQIRDVIEPSIILPLESPIRRYRAYLGHDVHEPQQIDLPFAMEMVKNRKSG